MLDELMSCTGGFSSFYSSDGYQEPLGELQVRSGTAHSTVASRGGAFELT